jgi:hypothetical protein
MTLHRVVRTATATPADIADLLNLQPAHWLRTFLNLAISLAMRGQHHLVVSTFHLGQPSIADDGHRIPLTWNTRHNDVVFARFTGPFEVRPDGAGSMLTLSGECTGGDATYNERVLEALVHLLTSAASAAMTDQECR